MALLFASASALLRRSRSSAGAVIECDALGPARSMGEGRCAASATHFAGQRWAPRPPRCASAAGREVTRARALGEAGSDQPDYQPMSPNSPALLAASGGQRKKGKGMVGRMLGLVKLFGGKR